MASSVSATGTAVVEFTTESGTESIARSEITTTDASAPVSFGFEILYRRLVLRVGTSAGGEEVIIDTVFEPGQHVITFTPGAATYYIEWRLPEIGEATLREFQRLAAGNFELETPWTASELASLRHEQSLNTQWWTVRSKQTRALERRGSSSWSLRRFTPENGPFGPLNLSDEIGRAHV